MKPICAADRFFSAAIARTPRSCCRKRRVFTKVVDPLGGSYMSRPLTEETGRESVGNYRKSRCRKGGNGQGGSRRWPKGDDRESRLRPNRPAVDKGDAVIVGVNKYRANIETRWKRSISTMPRFVRARIARSRKCGRIARSGLVRQRSRR